MGDVYHAGSIFKPKQVRSVEHEAYKPKLVSIGPYHRQDAENARSNLNAMQKAKQDVLDSLLARVPTVNVDAYNTAFEHPIARKFYRDYFAMNDDDFKGMMAVDGCFIVEFLRICTREVENDPIKLLQNDWKRKQIALDLLLVENQIPYYILLKFHDMSNDPASKYPAKKSLKEMVMICFDSILPRQCHRSSNFVDVDANGIVQISHLLHFVHIYCRPPPHPHQTIVPLPNNDNEILMLDPIGSAVELREAGISFQNVCKEDFVSLFDVDFTDGKMKLPCFKVDEFTGTLLRNLIAFEQHGRTDASRYKYFSEFAILMNRLIDSEADVKLLRRQGIITNLLSEDTQVSQLFNRLDEEVTSRSDLPYYHSLHKKLNKHCNSYCKVQMAKLKLGYFYNTWAGLASAAAVLLLILTAVQTITSILSLTNR